MEIALAVLLVAVVALGIAVVVLATRRPPAPEVDVDDAMRRALLVLRDDADQRQRAALGEAVRRLQEQFEQVAGASRQLAAQERGADRERVEQQLGALQQRMSADLSRLGESVEALQERSQTSLSTVLTTLTDHRILTEQLSQTTQTLREVLASPKRRGQWGERMAEDILRLAGLEPGVSYRTQTAIAGGGIPDLTLLLPRDLVLHVDAKFPLDGYVAALDAPTDAERERAEAGFVRDVRAKVKEVAARGYATSPGSLGYALVFVPNEGIASFLLERDPSLFDDALRQSIVLCSPSSLYSLVAVARLATDSFRVEQDADRILEAMGAFKVQWGKFSESLATVGKRIGEAQKAFENCQGVRFRQLERQVDRLDQQRLDRGLGDPEPEADLFTLPAVGE